MGITSSTEVAVGLLGISMLCSFTYQYFSGKRTCRLIIQYIFKQLITSAISNLVVNESMIVHLFILIGNDHTTQIDLSSTSGQSYFSCITRSTVMQSHTIQKHITVCLLVHIEVTETHCAGMGFFQFIKIESSIFFCKDLNNLSRKEIYIIHGMITNQQTSLRTFFQHNQHTAVHHKINISTQYVHQLNGFVHHHAFRHIQHKAILGKSSIEGGHTILGSICQLTIILLDQSRILFRQLFQAAKQHSFRQLCLRQSLTIKSIVYYKIKSGTHIRYIALEHFIRIHRNVESVQIQTIIRLEQLAHIRIFILLLFAGRET